MTTEMNIRRLTILLAFALAAIVGAVSPVAAQGSDVDASDVLQRTEEILRDINVIVQESDSEQARRIFRDAVAKQIQAVQQLAAERPAMAVRLSLKAREIGRQAERIALGSQNHQERARRYLERLQDMHRDVKDRAQEAGNQQAMNLVHRAETLFVRARDQFNQTHYESAFRLLEEAETVLRRAARLLLDTGDAEGLEQELDRTENLIAVARDRLDDTSDPSLGRKLDQAERALSEAREALAADNPLLALRRARHSRQLAQQVLRQSGGAPETEAVEREFERFDARQEDLTARVAEARAANAARPLGHALGLRHDAGRALEDGRPADALRIIRSALNLQRQAAEFLP